MVAAQFEFAVVCIDAPPLLTQVLPVKIGGLGGSPESPGIATEFVFFPFVFNFVFLTLRFEWRSIGLTVSSTESALRFCVDALNECGNSVCLLPLHFLSCLDLWLTWALLDCTFDLVSELKDE